VVHAVIPSLDNANHKLVIQSLPSNDVAFQTGVNAPALARLGNASLFSSYRTPRHMQSLLMEMASQPLKNRLPLQGALYTLLSDGPVSVITFRTDDPEVDAAVLKTTDNLVGIQTFRQNWMDLEEKIPVVWLGQCDMNSDASRHLERLYAQCNGDLFPAFEKRGKARKDFRSIDDVVKPFVLER